MICIDIQIGWQVSGQQDDRLADTHVYVYICLIASMPTYLISYIYCCIYNDLHGYKEVLACIRSAGIRSAGRR